MSNFAKNAVELLYAAENALGGREEHAPSASERLSKGYPAIRSHHNAALVEPAAPRSDPLHAVAQAELLKQLSVAMREIAELRAMLMEERDARTALLVSMGKRWKEEIRVEMRGGDLELRRLLADLEGTVGENVRGLGTQLQLVQQYVDDHKRHSKVYATTRMDVEERMRDELEDLKGKLHAATAMCHHTRVECVQVMEREKASIAQRLDTELLRYAEMRRADERDVATAKLTLKEEVQRLNTTVRSVVQEQWREVAVTLEKSLREPVEELREGLKQHGKSFREWEHKVDTSLHSQESEWRTTATTLKDRLSSLESAEAVSTSRVDRAERKCDMVVETVSKVEAQLKIAREAVDDATAVAQRAAERTQHVEGVQLDRDARLSQLESHLKAISTAEALKAEIEACRRQTSRVESHVDALRAVAEREESATERLSRQAEALRSQIGQVERSGRKTEEELQTFMEQSLAATQRVSSMESTVDQVKHLADRLTLASERVEQRVEGVENRHGVLSASCDQLLKDVHHVQHTFSTRIEAAQDLAARSETASATAKAEVERVEKRVLKLEATQSTQLASWSTLQSQAEDNAKEISSLHRRQVQNQDWISARESRLDEKMAAVDDLVASIDTKILKVERGLQAQCSAVEQRIDERVEEIDARSDDIVKKVNQEVSAPLQDWKRRLMQKSQDDLQTLETQIRETQHALERLAGQTSREKAHFATREHLRQMEDHIRERDGRTQGNMEDIRAAQHQYKGILQNMRTQHQQFQQLVQQLQGDLGHFAPVVSSHGQRIEELFQSLRSIDAAQQRLEQQQREAASVKPEPAAATALPPAPSSSLIATAPTPVAAGTTPTTRTRETHSPEKTVRTTPAAVAQPSTLTTELNASSSRHPAVTVSKAQPSQATPPKATAPVVISKPPAVVSKSPAPSSPTPATQMLAKQSSPEVQIPTPSTVTPKSAVGTPKSTAAVTTPFKAPPSPVLTSTPAVLASLPSPTKAAVAPMASLEGTPDGRLVSYPSSSGVAMQRGTQRFPSSTSSVTMEVSGEATPPQEERQAVVRSPAPDVGTAEKVGGQAGWFGSTSETPSHQSAEESSDAELNAEESDRLARSAERPRHPDAGLHHSAPQTLQSLIETASASGRSRSAVSERSAGQRNAAEGGHTWDNWDSTTEEESSTGEVGGEADEYDHIDVYHQEPAMDASHQELGSGEDEDVIIPLEAVLSEPARPVPTGLFHTVTNRPSPASAAAATTAGRETVLPFSMAHPSSFPLRSVDEDTEGHSDDDAVLPGTREGVEENSALLPRKSTGADGPLSVQRSTQGSGSRSSGTTHSSGLSRNSGPPPAPASGTHKMYSNFDSSSDEDAHQIV